MKNQHLITTLIKVKNTLESAIMRILAEKRKRRFIEHGLVIVIIRKLMNNIKKYSIGIIQITGKFFIISVKSMFFRVSHLMISITSLSFFINTLVLTCFFLPFFTALYSTVNGFFDKIFSLLDSFFSSIIKKIEKISGYKSYLLVDALSIASLLLIITKISNYIMFSFISFWYVNIFLLVVYFLIALKLNLMHYVREIIAKGLKYVIPDVLQAFREPWELDLLEEKEWLDSIALAHDTNIYCIDQDAFIFYGQVNAYIEKSSILAKFPFLIFLRRCVFFMIWFVRVFIVYPIHWSLIGLRLWIYSEPYLFLLINIIITYYLLFNQHYIIAYTIGIIINISRIIFLVSDIRYEFFEKNIKRCFRSESSRILKTIITPNKENVTTIYYWTQRGLNNIFRKNYLHEIIKDDANTYLSQEIFRFDLEQYLKVKRKQYAIKNFELLFAQGNFSSNMQFSTRNNLLKKFLIVFSFVIIILVIYQKFYYHTLFVKSSLGWDLVFLHSSNSWQLFKRLNLNDASTNINRNTLLYIRLHTAFGHPLIITNFFLSNGIQAIALTNLTTDRSFRATWLRLINHSTMCIGSILDERTSHISFQLVILPSNYIQLMASADLLIQQMPFFSSFLQNIILIDGTISNQISSERTPLILNYYKYLARLKFSHNSHEYTILTNFFMQTSLNLFEIGFSREEFSQLVPLVISILRNLNLNSLANSFFSAANEFHAIDWQDSIITPLRNKFYPSLFTDLQAALQHMLQYGVFPPRNTRITGTFDLSSSSSQSDVLEPLTATVQPSTLTELESEDLPPIKEGKQEELPSNSNSIINTTLKKGSESFRREVSVLAKTSSGCKSEITKNNHNSDDDDDDKGSKVAESESESFDESKLP